MSTNGNHNHNNNNGNGNNGTGNGAPIDPCEKRIKEEAEYNRGVRCKNCKLIFCIIASVAVATAAILMISGAVALWPAQEDDENLPLILTVPQQCCQDNNNDNDDDDDDDDRDRDRKHHHKDKHHDDDD